MVGEDGPVAEARIIQILWQFLSRCGVSRERASVAVIPLGCSQCIPSFRSSFSGHLRSRSQGLCKTCKHFFKTNPARILNCEEEKCSILAAHAPQILDFLCESCKKHLRGFLEFLDEMRIPYYLEPKRLRTGSPYNSIIFEFMLNSTSDLRESADSSRKQIPGSWTAKGKVILGEGGRLSKLGEAVTGRRIAAAGGMMFADTLMKGMGGLGIPEPESERTKVFLVQLGELARRRSMNIFEMLRNADIPVMESLGKDAIKSQLKIAERMGAEIALIVGQKEAIDGTAIVREAESGIQETVPQEKLIEFLKRKLKK